MKATVIAMGMLASALVSFAAVAQQGSAQQEQQRFDEVKQRTEQRIQDRIADLQGRLTCVQNAQDPEALRACFPKRAAGRAGPGGPNGGGPKPQ
jgi:CHASE1-domain containing sensor protein